MGRLLNWLFDTRDYLRDQPMALALVVVAGFGGASLGLPAGESTSDYMWRDPGFCGACHVHDYANEAWARSVHSELTTCHDCHRVPIRHYPRNLYLALFDRPQTPEEVHSAEVGVVLCEQCHSESGAEEHLSGPLPDELRVAVPKVDHSPLHRAHLDAEGRAPTAYHGGRPAESAAGSTERIECLDCHGGEDFEVHTFSADSRDCVACHEGIAPTDEVGAELSCLDCHARGFIGGAPPSNDSRDEHNSGGEQ